MTFLSFWEATQLIAEKTGGDGESILVAAAAAGRIKGEAQCQEYVTDGPAFDKNQSFRGVPTDWWADIDNPDTKLLGYRVYLRAAKNRLINQKVLGFHPGTEIPASQHVVILCNIRFSKEEIDALVSSLIASQPTSDSSAKAVKSAEDDPRERGIIAVIDRLGEPGKGGVVPWGRFWEEVLRICGYDPAKVKKKAPQGYGLRTIQDLTRKILKERPHEPKEI